MKKNTGYDITARFERRGDKFVVKYKKPSAWDRRDYFRYNELYGHKRR